MSTRKPSRNRSRSPLHKDAERGERSDRTDAPPSADFLSVTDLKKFVTESIASQLPTIIVEASKVARAGLMVDKEDSAKQMAKEMKQLKQSHEDLATVSKAASLKSEGTRVFFLNRIHFFVIAGYYDFALNIYLICRCR